MTSPLLEVAALSVTFRTNEENVVAVHDVSFTLSAGERLGIAGESGAGKSATLLAVTGLLPPDVLVSGSVRHGGRELLDTADRELRQIRGRRIATIFQDPTASLNPRLTVGQHLVETIRTHHPLSRRGARARAIELLRDVELGQSQQVMDEHPHRLSGGMNQRVMIALALSGDPDVLLADEPTTALDTSTQRKIVDLIIRLSDERGLGVVLVSHDLALLAGAVSRLAIMHDGAIVDQDTTASLLRAPGHPHSQFLVSTARKRYAATGSPSPCALAGSDAALLTARNITKTFRRRGGGRTRSSLRAVDVVHLKLLTGEALALVGESGSGKTTLARCLTRLIEPDAGSVTFDDLDVGGLHSDALRMFRRRVGMVFQDPYSTLNPRMTVDQLIGEPVRVRGRAGRATTPARVTDLLDEMRLPTTLRHRFPHELSGGQRQRVSIARALATEPDVLILDEPVASLDAPTAAQIMALIADLLRSRSLSSLLISHDLSIVRRLATAVAVMHQGRIVERGPTDEVLATPAHPYTQRLLEAAPTLAAGRSPRADRSITADDSDPIDPSSDGCPYENRCPHADDTCRTEQPHLMAITPKREVACWHPIHLADRTDDNSKLPGRV